ncbi:MAG: alpha/beta hydrolase-fold protein [Planctomycetota bacterium]
MLSPIEDWGNAGDASPMAWASDATSAPAFLAIVLHELPEDDPPPPGPTPDVLAWSRALTDRGAAVVAPWTGASWWTDGGVFAREPKPLSAEAAVERSLDWLTDKHELDASQVALVGAGMGGHGALRLAYRQPQRYPAVAALRPAIDWHHALDGFGRPSQQHERLAVLYGDSERARQDSATLHIHPLNWPRHQRFDCPPADPRHEGAERLRMKLTALGVPHEADTHSPDAADYDTLRVDAAAEWLAERLGR